LLAHGSSCWFFVPRPPSGLGRPPGNGKWRPRLSVTYNNPGSSCQYFPRRALHPPSGVPDGRPRRSGGRRQPNNCCPGMRLLLYLFREKAGNSGYRERFPGRRSGEKPAAAEHGMETTSFINSSCCPRRGNHGMARGKS
jgi:hypothetical protein